jgi:hypothetical protein
MINSQLHPHLDNLEKDLAGRLGNQQYTLKSEKLEYRDSNIFYSRTIDQPISLKNYVIPIDQVSPRIRRLVDEPIYLNTALALADYKIRRSKNNEPPRKSIQAAITNYWNTILFLRTRGIFQLKDATQEEIDFICQKYSEAGWANVLNLNEKIESIIRNMDAIEFRASVSLYAKRSMVVDSMKSTYWTEKLGFIPAFTLNEELMTLFQIKGKELGFTFTDRFSRRFQTPVSGPTDNGVRNLLSFFNHLYLISGEVDKLSFYPFDTPRKTSLKYSQKQSERTGNLGIEEATHILGKAFEWIYDHGPSLVSILEVAREQFLHGTMKFKERFLIDDNPFQNLASTLNIPLPNTWSQKDHSTIRKAYYYPVDRLIGALQGACAVAIAGLNARRSAEVADSEIGLRGKDLLTDPESGFHMINFYIEKSYQERHTFFISKVTFDAFNLLMRLKEACLAFGEDPDILQNESLFDCGSWKCREGPSRSYSFVFAKAKNQRRSMCAFLSFLNDEYRDVDLKSHMWRRFFGLIYIYRYDHSTLQSLSQHLRHMDISRTMIYVTDNDARVQSEQIANKIPSDKTDSIRDRRLISSLIDDGNELGEALLKVSNEKLSGTVSGILNGERFSGGFPRLVRKLYASLSRKLDFSKVNEVEKANAISTTLLSKGYSALPMPHGQCNAPDTSHTFGGKCANNGHLERHKASASFCQRCMYHSKNDSYVNNLIEEVSLLDQDLLSGVIPHCKLNETKAARQALIEVIEIHNVSASQNAELTKILVKNNASD